MSKYYEDTYPMPEYDAVLYTNKKTAKKTWSVRIKLQGRNGYVVKSCKTTKLHIAVEFAKKLAKRTHEASSAGLDPKRSYKFCDVFEEYLAFNHRNKTLSHYRYKSISGDYERYFKEFFAEYEVQEIRSAIWENYKMWRRDYWKSASRIAAAGNRARSIVKANPSNSTLRQNRGNFYQFLRWCAERDYIASVPIISPFKKVQGQVKKRGVAFERWEWAKLISAFREDAFEEGNPNLSAAHYHQRRVIYYASLFMCGTMLRPSEVFRIKWADISWKDNRYDPDDEDLVIKVSEHVSKTKKHRTAIGTCSVARHMRAWRELSGWTDRDDYVFCMWGGERQGTINKSFVNKCRELNILFNPHGVKRTTYSCRHTGITFALNRKISEIDVSMLAGTSLVYIRNNYYSKNMEKRSSDFATQYSNKTQYDDEG